MRTVLRCTVVMMCAAASLAWGTTPAGAAMTCRATADEPAHNKRLVGSTAQIVVPYIDGDGHGHCDWAVATGVAACLLFSAVPEVNWSPHTCSDNGSAGDDSSTTATGACASGFWTTTALATGAGPTGSGTSDAVFSSQVKHNYCMPQVIAPPQPD